MRINGPDMPKEKVIEILESLKGPLEYIEQNIALQIAIQTLMTNDPVYDFEVPDFVNSNVT